MDYNIRAARAGFGGVWVGAAYAYRHPPTERRRVAEARQMGRSRRLYQDRFCGLRLNRLRVDYEDHCRGEACEFFAPADLITIRRPLHGQAAVPPPRSVQAAAPSPRPRAVTSPVPRSSPLVTAVMPTRQRPEFAVQAARYFLAQDYPAKELLVLKDGTPSLTGRLPQDPRIRYVATRAAARSIGAMRNEACRLARGDIVAHWDDDDWAAPGRLSVQVAELTSSGADICGTVSLLYYDQANATAWRFSWPSGLRPWAAGPSLCFARDLWAGSPFPEVAIGEDTRFVFSPAVRRIADVSAAACIVGIIHGRNTAPKTVTGAHWSPRPVREVEDLLGTDMDFYRGLRNVAVNEFSDAAAGHPYPE